MWIMLTTKLHTEVSPPKMSLHWATPWPDDKYAKQQKSIIDDLQSRRGKRGLLGWNDDIGWGTVFGADDPETARFYTEFGQDPNWIGAVKIHYKGTDIRVFPHEFSKLDAKRMKYYVAENAIFTLVESETATMPIAKLKLDPDQKQIYDSALLDGCSPQQATLVMLGIDISDEEVEFPPNGWYRLYPDYANIFCYESEMIE